MGSYGIVVHIKSYFLKKGCHFVLMILMVSLGYAVNGVTEHDRLPCCGIGIGWLLFILGFFFGAIPWYIGFFLFLFSRNPREKPGYIACAIGAVIATIFIVIGAVRGSGAWS